MQVTPIQPLEATARAILAGTAVFYDEDTPFGEDEWKLAADDALAGDDRDLRHMLRRQAQFAVWCETQPRWEAAYGRGEVMPFEDWVERVAERRAA